MGIRLLRTRWAGALAVTGLCCVVTACGSSNSSNSSSSASSTSATSGGSKAFTASSLAAAKANLAPYLGKPSPILATQPLTKRLPAGSKIVYMNCQVPTCESFVPSLKEAAAALSLHYSEIPTGSTAASISAAFDTAAQEKPSAVVDPALDPTLWPGALKKLKEEHVPVVANAIPEGPGNGIAGETFGINTLAHDGTLLADYIYTQTGNESKPVFVYTPEYTFTIKMSEQFKAEFAKLCASCKVTTLSVEAGTIGTTLPEKVVSEVQRQSGTNWVGGAFADLVDGVPEAMRAAGLDVKVIDANSVQQNYNYVKNGQEAATLATDYQVQDWILLDEAERAATGQPIPAAEQASLPPSEFLTAKEINFDTKKLWIAYPDYQQKFKKLWGVE